MESLGNPVTLIPAVFVLAYTVPCIIDVFLNFRNIIHDEFAFLYLSRILVFILLAIGFIIAGVDFLISCIKAWKKSTDAKGEHLAKTGLTILRIDAIIDEICLIINFYLSYSTDFTSGNNDAIKDKARKLMATVSLSTLGIIFFLFRPVFREKNTLNLWEFSYWQAFAEKTWGHSGCCLPSYGRGCRIP